MNFLFQKIRVINPSQNLDMITDLQISEGKIVKIGSDSLDTTSESNLEIINADGWVCSPGLFDMHVHFRYPGQTHKEDLDSGNRAAANGGFTGVVCMPNTSPAIDNVDIVELIQSKTKDLITDVYLSAAITVGRKGEKLTNMMELADKGVVLFTDDGDPVINANVMKNAFDYSATYDLMLSQHCEETSISKGYGMHECDMSQMLGLKGYPRVAEEMIVARDILLAEYCGNRRYHAQHLSSKGSVDLLRQAKKKGLNVSGEVSPHHFSLTYHKLENYDTNYKMNPPLRDNEDIDALIEGLQDGSIDCIATDHAPHSIDEKNQEFDKAPNGILGLETSLGVSLTYLFHTNKISMNKLIELMSTNPRKLLKLEEIKIELGNEANLTIFDPNENWQVNQSNFQSKSSNSPYIGKELKGKPKFTFNNKQVFKSLL